MVAKGKPNYTELVHEVLRSAAEPLTFAELFEEVNRRQPVTTRDPKATLRNALSQSKLPCSLGDGRYGYLPHLLQGSLFRLPFAEKKPSTHPLVYTNEIRVALWPTCQEVRGRRDPRPARLRLPTSEEVVLRDEFLGPGTSGSSMPEGLRRYLTDNRAADGDALLIHALDAGAGRYEARLERRRERDEAAVARRNRELADAAYQVLRKSRSGEEFVWDLAIALMARGLYRAATAPDPLKAVLMADPRFVDAGLFQVGLAEHLTPEKEASIGDRKKVMADLLADAAGALADLPVDRVALAGRGAAERVLADVGRILSEQQFGSLEEANAFLQDTLAKGGLPRRAPTSPLEEAQDLIYNAWDAVGPERVRLARRALQISPDCADAYSILAEETARTLEEAADLYARGVAAGERALGKQTFERAAGHFWDMVETRPYMRARAGLAQCLWEMGRQREAIEHYQEMLRLNPGDNQGTRYLLLPSLLETGHLAGARKLLDSYPDDATARWAYGRALLAFAVEGGGTGAGKLLAAAKKANPRVPAYLLGRKRMPEHLPDLVGFGDESEAVVCAAEQIDAWRAIPGALRWLDALTNR